MAIEAELHDGTILEFPDNTAPDVVDRAVKNHLSSLTASPAKPVSAEPVASRPDVTGINRGFGFSGMGFADKPKERVTDGSELSGGTVRVPEFSDALTKPVTDAERLSMSMEPTRTIKAPAPIDKRFFNDVHDQYYRATPKQREMMRRREDAVGIAARYIQNEEVKSYAASPDRPPMVVPDAPMARAVRPGDLSLTDAALALKQGVGDIGTVVGKGLQMAGADEAGSVFRAGGKRATDRSELAMTPGAQAALNEPIFNDDLSMGESPLSSMSLQALRSVPSMIATLPAGGTFSVGLTKLGGKTLAGLATRPGVVGALARVAPTAAGAGAAEGIQAAFQNAAQTEDDILAMPMEQIRQSPKYAEYMAQTDKSLPFAQRERAVRAAIAKVAADEVAMRTAISTGVIGMITGGGAQGMVLRRMGGKQAADGLIKTTAKGIGEEALQEAPQSAGEQYIQNVATRNYVDASQDPTQGVIGAAASGAAVGGLTGGVMGGGGHVLTRGARENTESGASIARADLERTLNGEAPTVPIEQLAQRILSAQPSTLAESVAVPALPDQSIVDDGTGLADSFAVEPQTTDPIAMAPEPAQPLQTPAVAPSNEEALPAPAVAGPTVSPAMAQPEAAASTSQEIDHGQETRQTQTEAGLLTKGGGQQAQTNPAAPAAAQYEQGAEGENGSFRTANTAKREEEFRSRGLQPVAAGGAGEIWVQPEEAKFIADYGFGRSHLNLYALQAYQAAKSGAAPDDVRNGFVQEMTDQLGQSADQAGSEFDRLWSAATAVPAEQTGVRNEPSTVDAAGRQPTSDNRSGGDGNSPDQRSKPGRVRTPSKAPVQRSTENPPVGAGSQSGSDESTGATPELNSAVIESLATQPPKPETTKQKINLALSKGKNAAEPAQAAAQAEETGRPEGEEKASPEAAKPAIAAELKAYKAKKAAEKIDDIGEKIGAARKDTAVSTGPGRKKTTEDDRPAWARRFEISQIVTPGGMIGEVAESGRWIVRDNKSLDWAKQPRQVGRQTFATKEDAEAFVPIAAVSMKHRPIAARDGKFEIWREITDRKRVKVVDQQFDSREEANAYMAQHAREIIETNTTFGEADMPLPPNRARSGPERRQGDVVGADFMAEFGLRGVEFGNWNNQEERQSLMNDAYDGLLDLADVLGIPPKAIGLDGDLALAFGARGHGLQGARAHYELGRAVINLTKERGAGSLAHEWFHALDHYFGRQDGKASATWEVQSDGTRTLKISGAEDDMASSGFSRGEKSGVRPELRAAYESLLKTMVSRAETYVDDTAKVDKFTGSAREDLESALQDLRRELAAQKDVRYYKRKNAPATADQLAEFDAIAKQMVDGEVTALETDWRSIKDSKASIAARWTNDSLERISAIYKAVRGRSGFDGTNRNGLMDKLGGYMGRYSQRLKMLAEAQSGAEKTRQIPTEFAMNARELDQGRNSNYWTTPHEMAARAFQGYVEDKIADRGGVSRFLNYGPEKVGILTPWGLKRPFPAGEERKSINAAFDRFLGEIKTKETDKGVAMFSRSGKSVQDRKDTLRNMSAVQTNKVASLQKARELYRDGIGAVVRTADGHDVQQTGTALRKMSNHGADPKMHQVIGNIQQLLGGSIQLWSEPVREQPERGTIRAYHHYGVKADLNGTEAYVRIVVRENENGEMLYDGDAISVEETKMPSGSVGADRIPNAGPQTIKGSSRLAQWLDSVNEDSNTEADTGTDQAADAGRDRIAAAGRKASSDANPRADEEGLSPGAKAARALFGNPAPQSTVESVKAELASSTGELNADRVRVVQSITDLPAKLRKDALESRATDLEGLFDPQSQTTYLIADNIAKGEAFAVLMHEAGVHMGMRGLIGDANMKTLSNHIKLWSEMDNGSEHSKLAKLAMDRIPDDTPAAHRDEELIAYFVTEAVKAGHGDAKPDAKGPIARWFAKLWDAVKSAIAKLGADPAKLTTDDVVALARGALERSIGADGQIEVDGVMRPTTNSNGKPIAQTEEGVRNFWRWFGDSKVVDEQGRPLVVYHGTGDDFSTFDPEQVGKVFGDDREGFFFSGSALEASRYAEHAGKKGGGNVMPVYLRMSKPYTFSDYAFNFAEKDDADAITAGRLLIDWVDREKDAFLPIAKDEGFDGAFLKRRAEIVAIAFSPEQIKSATGNRGTFDSNDPSILASRSGTSPSSYAFNQAPDGSMSRGTMKLTPGYRNGSKVGYQIADAGKPIGFVVLDESGDTLHNIDIIDALQGKGYGEKVIRGLLAMKPNGMNIDDIQVSALKFWRKLGTIMLNISSDPAVSMYGTLNWKDYVDQRIRITRAADRGQSAGADESRSGQSGEESAKADAWLRDYLGDDKPKFSRKAVDPATKEALRKAGLGDRPGMKDRLRSSFASITDAFKNRVTLAEYARQGLLDQFYGLLRAERATVGNLPAEQSAYIAARLSTGSSSVMRGLLTHGAAKWAANGQHLEKIEGSKGLLDILKPVQDDIDDWMGWMIGNRAARLKKEGRENNFTQEDIDALQALGKGNADRFRKVAQEFAAFKRSVLDIAEQAGLIDADGRKVWDHADWIPFYREREDGTAVAGRGKRGLSGQTSGIRTLKGGTSALNDPLENILLNFNRLIDSSLKNNALRKFVRNVEGGEILERVGYDMKSQAVPKEQIRKELIASGVPPEVLATMPPEVFDGMAKMWSIQAPSDPDVIRIMDNGKPQFYRVHDPLALQAMTSFAPYNFPGMKTMRAFKRLLTSTTTATPAFMARNFIRDTASTFIISKDRPAITGAMRGLIKSWKESGGYEDMTFAGASFAGGYIDAGHPEEAARAIRRSLRTKGFSAASADKFMASIIDTPAKLWEKYREIGEGIENANREAVFENAKRAGKSDTAAAYESKDLMDFSLRGSWQAYRMIADITPFFNARVQGLYRLGRTNPKALALRGALMLTLPSVLLALANAGNDDYEELPDWDKDSYWHLFINGQHYRIPKPFEVGTVFATFPERITAALLGKDSPKKLASCVWWNITDQLNLLEWPQMAKPVIENWANKDTFTGRAIENQSDEGKLPHLRYNSHTSDTMRMLVGEMGETADTIGLSPKKAEHLVSGYLGSMGVAGLSLLDILARQYEGTPDKASRRLDEYPLIGTFYREDPAQNTQYVEDLYGMASELNKVLASVRALERDGHSSEAAALMEKYKGKLDGLGAEAIGGAKAMTAYSKAIDAIQKDRTLTPQEKRKEISRLQKDRNADAKDIAKRALTSFGGVAP